MTKQKSLINPADRCIPVNVSLPLKVLDVVDEESFRLFGRKEGKRSETITMILKDHLHIK